MTTKSIRHGGHITESHRRFPDAPRPWLDLSTGINAIPYPLPALPPTCFTRLPEPDDVARLETVAADAYGVSDPRCVAAAPGTQILIDLLPRLWPLRKVAVLGPTYAEHAHAWTKAGSRVTTTAEFGVLDQADAAVLCNPNNPDGRRIPTAALSSLADRIAARGGLLVVDEAFADLEGQDISVAASLPHPALVVLRSFGKTYGLAGVRLGFALASPARADAIRAALGPWAVSGPALAAGLAALPDRAWRIAAESRLNADVAALDTVLMQAGLVVRGGTKLFRLAHCDDASGLCDRLGRAGIMVRRFDDHPQWLRFGVPANAGDLARLRNALGAGAIKYS